jgi:hypothetical protein
MRLYDLFFVEAHICASTYLLSNQDLRYLTFYN